MAESNATPVEPIVRVEEGRGLCEVCFRRPPELSVQLGVLKRNLCDSCTDHLMAGIQDVRTQGD